MVGLIAKTSVESPMLGDAQSGLVEVLANRPTTAHILGGCPMGLSIEDGVVDLHSIPANLGVNPSLTITAMAEHAMSHIPPKSSL